MSESTPPARSGPAGPHTVTLRLVGVHDKAGFLVACARDLALPDHFGHNWDALADCLTDLSWWPDATGRVLRVEGWAGFRAAAPEAADAAAGVLADAEAYWTGRPTPLTVRMA